jgi:hypothetical protein
MLENYREMREILGGTGASDRAAKIIFEKIYQKAISQAQ